MHHREQDWLETPTGISKLETDPHPEVLATLGSMVRDPCGWE